MGMKMKMTFDEQTVFADAAYHARKGAFMHQNPCDPQSPFWAIWNAGFVDGMYQVREDLRHAQQRESKLYDDMKVMTAQYENLQKLLAEINQEDGY